MGYLHNVRRDKTEAGLHESLTDCLNHMPAITDAKTLREQFGAVMFEKFDDSPSAVLRQTPAASATIHPPDRKAIAAHE